MTASVCPAGSDMWLTAHDVARELKVSVRTVTHWTQLERGRLLAVKVGSVTRIRRAALENWLRSREAVNPSPRAHNVAARS